jgi:hypothetical protein
MPSVLICTQADLEADLGRTLLWRHDIERHFARRLEDARMMAVAVRPGVIVVDRDLPRADKLVSQFREDASTRRISLAIVARGDFEASEVGLLEAGANALLRIPPDADWDERLHRLFEVPARKEARFPVQFAVEATGSGSSIPALALNLSLNGLLLESSIPVSVGDDLMLVMRLPGLPQPAVAGGRVVRQAAPTQFGVEFRRIEPAVADRVRACVATLGS